MKAKGVKKYDLYKLVTTEMKDEVARLLGFTRQYVSQVLNPNDKRKNAEVVALCEALIEGRKVLSEEMSQFSTRLKKINA